MSHTPTPASPTTPATDTSASTGSPPPPPPPRTSRPALGRSARWLPFELLVALRFLREGRMQTVLILAGVTGGVAVIIFLTQLINQLQSTIIDRVLGSQAHIVIRPTEEVTRVPPSAQPPARLAAETPP